MSIVSDLYLDLCKVDKNSSVYKNLSLAGYIILRHDRRSVAPFVEAVGFKTFPNDPIAISDKFIDSWRAHAKKVGRPIHFIGYSINNFGLEMRLWP